LAAKPDAVDPAECIDALNVNFTDQGAIQQRPGYGKLTGSALTNRVDSLEPFYTSTGTKQLLAGCGTRLEALSTAGAIVSSKTSLEGGPWDFCRFGSPNEENAYAANGLNTLLKWSGAAWTAPTATVDGVAAKAMPKARYICIQSPDNRLVAAGFGTTTGGPNGTTSSPSTIYFSEDGKPEEWMTAGTAEHPNNSVQLTPGDGEKITGAIAWKEFVLVFKETKFFVFDGNSTDGEGNPVFNYRTVNTGVGCVSPRSICADANGVYFMSRTGMHRTTGQEPRLLSARIEPIWTGDISAFYIGGTMAHSFITNCAATLHQERLYLSFPTEEAANRVLVYDPELEWWSLYDFPAAAMASFRIESQAELVFGYSAGEKLVGRHSSAFTKDDSAVIASRWRSGWFDLDNPDVKTIRSSKIWGTEEVGMAMGHDFRSNPGTSTILSFVDKVAPTWGGTTWGGSTWAEPKGLIGAERRVAVRGTVFSVSFTGLGLPFSVHRIDHHLREIRKPSTVNA
jgi:hypothetical protein